MTKTMDFYMSLSAENPIELLRCLMEVKPFNQKPPTLIYLDMYAEHEGVSDWIDRWVSSCTHEVIAYWGNPFEEGEYLEGFLHFQRYYRDNTQIVKVYINDYPRSTEAVLEMLSPLPWQLAEFRSFHSLTYDFDQIYRAPGFLDSHFDHGWGCALKGAGHDHLVSRRWLEYGPWRLIRDEENDISLVQFHDLEADAITALEQAKPGHKRMGVSDTGGFINSKFEYETNIRAFTTVKNAELE